MFWVREEIILRLLQIAHRNRKEKKFNLIDKKRFGFGLFLEILDYETEKYEIKMPLHTKTAIAKWMVDLIIKEQNADKKLIRRIVKYVCEYLGFREKVRKEIEELI